VDCVPDSGARSDTRGTRSSSAAAHASSAATLPYCLTSWRTPWIRRIPSSPWRAWMASQTAPILPQPCAHAPAAEATVSGVRRDGPHRGCDAHHACRSDARAATRRCGDQADARTSLPLHVDLPADPARRRSIVSRINLDATIDMPPCGRHTGVAKRLQRKRLQVGLLFSEHRRYLPLVRPWMRVSAQRSSQWSRYACASSRLSNFLPFQRRHLRMVDATLDFPFRSGSRTLHGSAVTP